MNLKKNFKKKLKGFTAILACLTMLLGTAMVTHAASYTPAAEYDNLPANIRTNCVAFARYKVPSLPGGLTYKQDKINIINSYTPSVGAIAITEGDQPTYGHVAYVEAVNGNQITTLNGGFTGGRITRITGTASEQKVLGYWVPNGGGTTPVSFSWSDERCEYDTINAFFYAKANTNVSGSFTQAGFTLWDESGNVVATKTENPARTGSSLEIWYNVTDETGVVLKEATNYRYQIYTTFNGTQYKTDVKNFRTNGQAANSWTQALKMNDYTYGTAASVPTAAAKYGTPIFTYSTEKNGTYSNTAPKNAGTYYVKATVPATEQYTALTAIEEFHITKAEPQYVIPKDITMTYGQHLIEILLPEGFAWMNNTELSGPIGDKFFEAYYTPEDTDNYNVIKQIRVPITVAPKDLSATKLTGIDKNTDLDTYKISDGDIVLVKDTDYTISSAANGDVVTVSVEFIGNYTGTTQTTYSIKETDSTGNESNGNNDKTNSKTSTNKADKNKTQKTSTSSTPKTGDSSRILLWSGLSVIGLLGTAFSLVIRRRKRI